MTKLALVVDERELSIIRAALLLLQEQVDALPEDLAEMITTRGPPMPASEIEQLSVPLHETARPIRDHAERELPQTTRVVGVERFPAISTPHRSM